MSDNIWTVEARDDDHHWTVWTAWVDRATAESEKDHAEELGYIVRIVRAQ